MVDKTPSDFPEIKDFWDVLCSVYSTKGIDLRSSVEQWAKSKRDALEKWRSEVSFDSLCDSGCSPVSLALCLWAIASFQRWQELWRTTMQSKRHRDKAVRSLEKAATALEELNLSFNSALLEDTKRSFREELRKTGQAVDLSSVTVDSVDLDLEPQWPSGMPAPPPTTVIRSLRFYARGLRVFDKLSVEAQAPSPEGFSRYLISGYVNRATGTFHDAEVSALIGSALGTGAYDETAHRVWRSRNYEQLDSQLGSLAELLLGVGVVTSSQA